MADTLGKTIPLRFSRRTEDEMRRRASAFREELATRRSVRHFSSDPVPLDVLDDCIAAAGSAPSGANKQPWHFSVVTDPEIRHALRLAAEAEERQNYAERMSADWKADLAHLGTDASKPHFDDAPVVVVLFRKPWTPGADGRSKNYYVSESVGIAAGFFLAALHHAGLTTVTHTPSPMDFCGRILHRPSHEKAFLVMPIGFPVEGCEVPDIQRFELGQIRSQHTFKQKFEK